MQSSHAAAMLYMIEAAIRVGLRSSTPREFICEWNETFVCYIIDSTVISINPYSEKFKKELSVKSVAPKKVEAVFK